MGNVYSEIVQFQGDHYNFGYMQGDLLKESPILINRKKQWASKSHHFLINEIEFKDVILTFAPQIWDEIQGLADSLKWKMEDAIREFGGYYLEYGRSGCSIFTGNEYMVRNYDNHPFSYEGRFTIYQPTDGGYAVIGPSMQITGRTDGMNEKGLAMGYNFINRKNSEDGFVCNMIGRIILETCANVDEAIDLLRDIPHRHSFSYVLLDTTGETFVVEASPRAVEVRQSNVCTNHFEELTEENRYRMDDSFRRQQAILKQQKNVTDAYTAYRMMNDTDKGIFSKKYGAWAGTLHTSFYFPQEMRIGFALGGDRLPLIFDFNEWMQGDKMKAKRIKGVLDSNMPFINMEEIKNIKHL